MSFSQPGRAGLALLAFVIIPATALFGQRDGMQAIHAKPGDQLVIRGWPTQAFGPPLQLTVDVRGSIVLPQVGEIGVTRIPINELRDTIRDRYARFIRNPEVDVAVMRRVTVNGAVLRPSVYFVDMAATLRDVIALAGGVSEVGNRKKISVIRAGVARHVEAWETDTTEATQLQSGDQVVVGRRTWIEINIIPVVSLGLATASFLLSLRRK